MNCFRCNKDARGEREIKVQENTEGRVFCSLLCLGLHSVWTMDMICIKKNIKVTLGSGYATEDFELQMEISFLQEKTEYKHRN